MPEDRPGEADWDPFWQQGRGKRSREARKQGRLANADVVARREQGLKEGYPEYPKQEVRPGSNKWRLLKEQERANMEEERAIQRAREELLEQREQFLREREQWISWKEQGEDAGIRLKSVSQERPERRPPTRLSDRGFKYKTWKTKHRDGTVSYHKEKVRRSADRERKKRRESSQSELEEEGEEESQEEEGSASVTSPSEAGLKESQETPKEKEEGLKEGQKPQTEQAEMAAEEVKEEKEKEEKGEVKIDSSDL